MEEEREERSSIKDLRKDISTPEHPETCHHEHTHYTCHARAYKSRGELSLHRSCTRGGKMGDIAIWIYIKIKAQLIQ